MLRVVKALSFFTILVAFATLMYVFASLPDPVRYSADTSADISRDTFFYISLALIALSNTVIFALVRNLKSKRKGNTELSDGLITMSHGFSLAFNIFFIVAMFFISMFNSGEQFDYNYFGYLIYLSIGLVVLLVLGLPYLVLKKIISSK